MCIRDSYKGETLVDKYVTDKNGQFTTKEYVCDNDWTIREITPSEGYLLDSTIHKVGAEPQLYTCLLYTSRITSGTPKTPPENPVKSRVSGVFSFLSEKSKIVNFIDFH